MTDILVHTLPVATLPPVLADGFVMNRAAGPTTVLMPTALLHQGVFNVMDYGAVGDGSTDDTTAIQAAITAAQAVTGVVFLPSRTFKHTGLTITASIDLVGSGWYFGGTVLLNSSLTNPNISITSGAGPRLFNMNVKGNRLTGGSSSDVLYLHSQAPTLLDRVNVSDAAGYGLHIVGNTSLLAIRNSYFNSNVGSAIYGRGYGAAQINAVDIFQTSVSSNLGHGIDLIGLRVNIRDGIIQGNGGVGIRINGSDVPTISCTASDYNITGNYFEGNVFGAIAGVTHYNGTGPVVQYATHFRIEDNYLSQKTAQSDASVTAAITLGGVFGSYKGLTLGLNDYEVDGSIEWVDFGSAHGWSTRLTPGLFQGEVFNTVYLNHLGLLTLVPGDSTSGAIPVVAVSATRGDTSQTIVVGTDPSVQLWATTLTANRTVTLSTTGAVNGSTFRVVRTGLGAFTLSVGGLKTIPSATAAFVDVTYNGSAWVLTGYGLL